jgi:hypothetical protein
MMYGTFFAHLFNAVSPSLTQFREKLVLNIPARDYGGNRPSKTLAKLESGANLVMCDVY